MEQYLRRELGQKLRYVRVENKGINLGSLYALPAKNSIKAIEMHTLVEAGFASKNDRVKILGGGTLSMPLEVTAHAFSKSAVAAIEAQQGKVVKL